MESATAKRGYSDAERFRELVRPGQKPRRIIWAHCHHHGGGYYFFDVRIHPFTPSETDRWAGEPDIRKVRGLCMACHTLQILYVGEDELREHRYRPSELCECGLPNYHRQPPREFLQQYNARPVPCRNGRTDA